MVVQPPVLLLQRLDVADVKSRLQTPAHLQVSNAVAAASPTLVKDVQRILPLSPQRLRERGYNQAHVLACALEPSKVGHNLLLRVKDTPPQRTLPRSERLRAVQDAFAVEPLRVAQLIEEKLGDVSRAIEKQRENVAAFSFGLGDVTAWAGAIGSLWQQAAPGQPWEQAFVVPQGGTAPFTDPTELAKMWILRKLLHPMDELAAIEFLLDKMKDTKTNAEFFEAMKR